MSQLSSQNSKLFGVLRWIGYLLPGDFLKTWFYLNVIAKPRKFVRRCLSTFYRMDHVYQVLQEASRSYAGPLSILEFGTAGGYAFVKMLYATQYLGLADRVTVHAFDSFEGLPPVDETVDQGLTHERWTPGSYKSNAETLRAYCEKRYRSYRIHPGYFEHTLTDEVLETLRRQPPILIWIDCDYYTSTRTVFEKLLPILPNGCVCYFDDYEFNYGSRLTCEARFVHELNQGLFGDDIELVFDAGLSLDSKRVYRFVRANPTIQYQRLHPESAALRSPRLPTNGSPLP